MLNYSFSTVLMTVLTSTVLICIIAVCFYSKRVLLSIGYKVVGVFLILTLVRFVFPFELPFARNIVLPESLSAVIFAIRHPFFTAGGFKVSLWSLFEYIWICGTVITMLIVIRHNHIFNRFVRRYGKDITAEKPYSLVLSKVCDSHKANIRIIQVPGLDTPRQKGIIHPVILLPQDLVLNETQLYYILRHEYSHYKHRDYLIRLGMNVLLAVYWWNPLCHVMSRQVDVMLEMHVDRELVSTDGNERLEYASTLICIWEKLIKEALPKEKAESKDSTSVAEKCGEQDSNTSSGTGCSGSLTKRVHVILWDGKIRKMVFALMLALVMTLFVGSYCFTFEAYYVSDDCGWGTEIPLRDMYAIMLEDGTYNIYYGELFIEHVDNLEHYSGIPVLNK